MSFSGYPSRSCNCVKDSHYFPRKTLSFVVSGYNYNPVPRWFDDELKPVRPSEYVQLHDKLMSMFTFRHPHTPKTWYMLTKEDIVPTVYERTTNTKCRVLRGKNQAGMTMWIISM